MSSITPPPLTLRDEEVMSLADVTDTVTQLDTEGKSAVSGEVRVTTGPMVNLNVYEFFDRPSVPGNYILIVEHEISSSGAGTPALQSGALPAGSTLTLVVKEYIRGAGGQGGHRGAPDGATGGAAVSTTVPTTIDVTTGYVWGGGGGGGAGAGSPQGPLQARVSGGGGGAGKASGPGGLGTFGNGSPGTTTTGGKGFVMQLAFGGAGGNPGRGGASGGGTMGGKPGGAAGPSIRSNGHPVTWIGDTTDNVRGPRS